MFERIVDFSLQNRAAVLFATLVVALFGWKSFRGLTIEAFPDPTDTQVEVITLFHGQPSEEVERQIGLPIERALNGTPGLVRLRNLSLFGLSFVTLTFDDATDVLFARSQVLERLRNAELPDGAHPELGPLATPIGEVYRYTLAGQHADPMTLRTLQEWVVAPALMRVPGVADVVSYGGLVREIHVQPDMAHLTALGLTLDDVSRAIREASVNASGGVLERGAEQFVLRSEGLFGSIEDVREARVATLDGVPVFLRDVAEVTNGWAPRQGVVSRGSDLDAVQGIVLMRRGENPSVVLAGIRDAVEKTNLRLEGEGVRIDPFYDRTDLVNTTLRTVGFNLLEGAILVVVVLFIFLVDIRAALAVGVLIPLSLLGAFIYLSLRGMSANLLSMGAVDFGIIVDGGVVIIESILLGLHGASKNEEPGDAPPESMVERVRRATLVVVRPTTFALLIIIAAYLPIFLLERVEGRMFAPMAHTVVSALVGALLFSLTLVPVLATFLWKKPPRHRESLVLKWATRLYRPTLAWSLARPGAILLLAVLLLGGTGVLATRLGSEFLPQLNEGGLYISFTLPSSVSLTEGRRLVPRITALIESNPQVDEVMSQLGRPEDGTDPKLANDLEFFVKLKPPKEWPKETPTLDDVVRAFELKLAVLPGLEANFSQPIADNVNESLSGQVGQVAVKVYGENLVELQAYAERVKGALSKVEGVADLGIVQSGEVPSIRVVPDRTALARHGIDMDEFQQVFQTALGGVEVGELWEGERKFDVVVRLPSASRDDIDSIRRLQIPVAGDVMTPLETLARVETSLGRASINRENGRRYIGIRMNVRGRDLGGFIVDAQARVSSDAPAKGGMSIEWGGEFENKERAMARLAVAVPIALLLTLVLLFNAFRSFSLALLTLAHVPFALTGGVVALWWLDMPLSVAAAVGFIALIGQASLNGVLVLTAVDERIKAGEALDLAIVRGCLERLRPVLMTAALAALGLVPAAMSRGIGSETQRPIAVVIVAGTVSACLLTLVVLPVSYRLLGAWTARRRLRAQSKEAAVALAG